MKLIRFAYLAIVIVSITSCATSSSESSSNQEMEKALAVPTSWSNDVVEHIIVPTKWLESFEDPMMLKLIEEAINNNIDLQITAANMNKAWLLVKKSGAALKPNADLSLTGTQSDQSIGSPSSNLNVGLQVSWELDVWGRLSAGVNESQARAQSADADYIFAKHSLSANVARTYLKVIEAKLQTDIIRETLVISQKTMRITQVRYDNGIGSAQDLALIRADFASLQEQLITIEGSQRDSIRALEVLLGRYPDAELEIPDNLPRLPPPPPAGLPSDMLEKRPDIVSAERQVAAAFNATDKAKAAQLPKLSLTGSFSGASNSLSNALDPTNAIWQLASNIIAPLFDGGKGKIDVKIATLEQKQAILNYAQKGLVAFSEVENNLDQSQTLSKREVALAEVYRQNKEAYRIADLRYKEGENSLLDTLQIQQRANSAKSNLFSIRRKQLEQRINLHLSLGGGW